MALCSVLASSLVFSAQHQLQLSGCNPRARGLRLPTPARVPGVGICSTMIRSCEPSNQPEWTIIEEPMQTQSSPDVSVWDQFISDCANKLQPDQATEMFLAMQRKDIAPDVLSYNALLSTYQQGKHFEGGLKVFEAMQRQGVMPDTNTYNILIGMCEQCEQFDRALQLFEKMQQESVVPDVVTYSAVIDACAKSKQADQALSLFHTMQQQGVVPNPRIHGALFSVGASSASTSDVAQELELISSVLDGIIQSVRNLDSEEALHDALEQQNDVLRQCRARVERQIQKENAPDMVRKSALFLQGYAEFLLGHTQAAADHVHASTIQDVGISAHVLAERTYLLAQIHLGNDDIDAAECSLRRTVALNPRYLSAYIDLMYILTDKGDTATCYNLAKNVCAIQPPLYWMNPWQRPDHYKRGLWGQPWWDSSSFPWAAMLEEQAGVILQELRQLEASASLENTFADVGTTQEHDFCSASLVDRGRWQEFVLLNAAREYDEQAAQNSARCPKTTELLNSIPAVRELAASGLGEAIFSRITPGTRLKPHCGGTNLRLTCHLCLMAPEPRPANASLEGHSGCMIRVGPTWRQWESGRCMIFDDSFEHEVVYKRGAVPVSPEPDRVVLLMRFWHPDLPSHLWPDSVADAADDMARHRANQLVSCSKEQVRPSYDP